MVQMILTLLFLCLKIHRNGRCGGGNCRCLVYFSWVMEPEELPFSEVLTAKKSTSVFFLAAQQQQWWLTGYYIWRLGCDKDSGIWWKEAENVSKLWPDKSDFLCLSLGLGPLQRCCVCTETFEHEEVGIRKQEKLFPFWLNLWHHYTYLVLFWLICTVQISVSMTIK